MTTPPDRTFSDVLSNLPENNVGSITPSDVGAIANLAKTSTFHDGAAETPAAAFSALFTRYIPHGTTGTSDDIYYARLMGLNAVTTATGTSKYRSAWGDLSGTASGAQYAVASATVAQPRVFTYSWDLAVRSGKQSFWAVTFYYLPSGTAWPETPTPSVSTVDSNWDAVKVHHSEPFWANSPVEYGAPTSTVEWVSESSGSRTIVLEPGDTLVPVVEYWGSGTAGDDPSAMDTSLIKWSLDVVSTGVAGTVPQDDAQYWSAVSNRASVEALLNQTSDVVTTAAMTSRPIFIDDVTAEQLPVSEDVLAGTTVYLTGEKRMFTYRGGGSLTDWVEVANLNTAFDNRRPVVAESTSSLTTLAAANNYSAGTLAYDTTDYGLKVWDGADWLAFATRQSGGKYPRIVSAATGSLPAATAVAPGTVLFDETTKELKVSDGTNLFTVKDLDAAVVATSGASLPASGTAGQQFYLTSGTQQGLYTYTSAGTGWTKPWNMPWGWIGGAKVTTSVSSPTTTSTVIGSAVTVNTVNVGSLSVSFTAVANRVYRFQWYASWASVANSVTGVGTDLLVLKSGTTSGVRYSNATTGPPGVSAFASNSGIGYATDLPAGGNTAVYVKQYITGSGTPTINYNSEAPWWLVVEDVGPVPGSTPA